MTREVFLALETFVNKIAGICFLFYDSHGIPESIIRECVVEEYGEGIAEWIFGK